MKKFILTLALAVAASTAAFAQLGGLSVGAGYQTNNYVSTYTNGNNSSTSTYDFGGFYAGASYTVLTLGPGISITPGIYFSSLSFSGSDTVLGVTGQKDWKESYLSIPVNFGYKINLLPGVLAIAPYVGPTFALGLSSKGTNTVSVAGTSTSSDFDMYNDDDTTYGKFNVYIGGGLAIDIVDMIRVTVGYNYGLLNRDSADNYTGKNSGVNFGVAYLF